MTGIRVGFGFWRRWLVTSAATGILWTASAGGDQTHPDLDPLFDRIAAETDPLAARELEVRIWELWMRAPDPQAQVLLVEGVRAMDRRQFETAGEILDALVEARPRFAEAWNRRATLHYLRGDLQASLDDIEETLNLEPRHFGAWSGMGLVLLRLDDHAGARAAFEAALRIHPNMMGPRMNLRMLRERGDEATQ